MGSGASTPDPPHPPPDYLKPDAPPPEELVTAEDIRRSKEGKCRAEYVQYYFASKLNLSTN